MTTGEIAMWYALAAVGLMGSAMFSGLETGIYTINRVRLHVRAHVPRSSAAVLEGMIQRPTRLLGTLLVGNNVVNYLATLSIGALLTGAGYTGWAQVAISAVILTPMLLIFGEVLPKDFFRSHADTIVTPFARPLLLLQYLLIVIGVLPLIDLFAGGMKRALRRTADGTELLHPRRVVTRLVREGVGHGVISVYQSAMVDRVLEFERLKVRDVMVPWARVKSVRAGQPVEAIWALADREPHARLPLLDERGQPVGVIETFDVLRHDPAACPPLRQLAGPIVAIDAAAPLHDALRLLQRERVALAIVLDAGKPVGLVTAKDLVEPIVGELDVW